MWLYPTESKRANITGVLLIYREFGYNKVDSVDHDFSI